MANSDVEVVSMALTQIGANPITAFTDNSVEARLATRFYTPTLDALLRAHNWNFATRRASLVELADAPTDLDSDYTHQFQLPQDPFCLFVLKTDLGDDEPFEIETYATASSQYRVLLCNDTSVTIKYIARITDPTLWDALFAIALTDRLAALFAYPLSRNSQLAAQQWEISNRSWPAAKSRDGQEGRALKRWESDSFTRVR
jgi:hypothetical protein